MPLTKEQIEAIKANPELNELYDSLNSDYTQKSQANAAFKSLIDELGFSTADDLKAHLAEWQRYGTAVEPIMSSIRESGIDVNGIDWTKLANAGTGPDGEPDDTTGPRHSSRGSKAKGGAMIDGEYYTKAEINAMVKEFQKGLDSHYEERFSNQDRLLDRALELQDLYREHFGRTGKFDMDAKKVVDRALEKKLQSLKDAYTDFYHDDMTKEEVEKEVSKRLETEKLKSSGRGDISNSPEAPVAPKFPGNIEHKAPGFKSHISDVLQGFRDGSLPKDSSSTPINASGIEK